MSADKFYASPAFGYVSALFRRAPRHHGLQGYSDRVLSSSRSAEGFPRGAGHRRRKKSAEAVSAFRQQSPLLSAKQSLPCPYGKDISGQETPVGFEERPSANQKALGPATRVESSTLHGAGREYGVP